VFEEILKTMVVCALISQFFALSSYLRFNIEGINMHVNKIHDYIIVRMDLPQNGMMWFSYHLVSRCRLTKTDVVT
jgi:hypothetical protein